MQGSGSSSSSSSSSSSRRLEWDERCVPTQGLRFIKGSDFAQIRFDLSNAEDRKLYSALLKKRERDEQLHHLQKDKQQAPDGNTSVKNGGAGAVKLWERTALPQDGRLRDLTDPRHAQFPRTEEELLRLLLGKNKAVE
ncbi:unnamed protein product, partial [Amoebophrya sp. A25]|eukprot:GSA25T00022493001.1